MIFSRVQRPSTKANSVSFPVKPGVRVVVPPTLLAPLNTHWWNNLIWGAGTYRSFYDSTISEAYNNPNNVIYSERELQYNNSSLCGAIYVAVKNDSVQKAKCIARLNRVLSIFDHTATIKWTGSPYPSGTCSPDVARALVRDLARMYDVTKNDLSATENNNAVTAITHWLKQMYDGYYATLGASMTWKITSHRHTMTCPFGVGALAIHGLHEESDKWLAWVTNYYRYHFPRWGCSTGGWSEGQAYASQTLVDFEFLSLAVALEDYTGIPIVSEGGNPWFRNFANEWYYGHPPHLKTTDRDQNDFGTNDWGDGSFGSEEGHVHARLLAWIQGIITNNPSLIWYSNSLYRTYSNESSSVYTLHPYNKPAIIFPFLGLSVAKAISPAEPAPSIANSQYICKSGRVAMTTNIADKNTATVVCAQFRPKYLTSVSHGHGQQGGFTLMHHNRVLVPANIGYWVSNDEHDPDPWDLMGNTDQASCLLIDGKGQPWTRFRDPELVSSSEKSNIISNGNTANIGYVCGSYGGCYVPNNVPIKYAYRYIALIRSSNQPGPYMVILDDVKTSVAKTVDWLLCLLRRPSITGTSAINWSDTSLAISSGVYALAHARFLNEPYTLSMSEPYDGFSTYVSGGPVGRYRVTGSYLPAVRHIIGVVIVPWITSGIDPSTETMTGSYANNIYTITVGNDNIVVNLRENTMHLNP